MFFVGQGFARGKKKRMTYVPEKSKVIYESKEGKKDRVFDALEWLKEYRKNWDRLGEQ